MSRDWPDPQGYWENQEGWGMHPGVGGYQPPPGYQSGGWPAPHPMPAPHAPYQPPFPQQPFPQPPVPQPNPAQGSATGALIVSILVTLGCGVTGVVGIVFSALGLGEKYDPDRARRFARYAWISNGVHLGLVALVAVILMVAVVAGA